MPKQIWQARDGELFESEEVPKFNYSTNVSKDSQYKSGGKK